MAKIETLEIEAIATLDTGERVKFYVLGAGASYSEGSDDGRAAVDDLRDAIAQVVSDHSEADFDDED